MTEETKKKMGRPKKEKKGAMIWCPDFCLEFVQTYIATEKQRQQAKQQ
jgi:hypothetical protein